MSLSNSKSASSRLSESQPCVSDAKQLLIDRLRGKMRRVETSGRQQDDEIVSSGSVAIDRLLPAGGYRRGTIIHWRADRGSGAELLSLIAAQQAIGKRGALVIVDPNNHFYPPAAHALGISVSQLIVLCGSRSNGTAWVESSPNVPDFLWAIDQSLRCDAVAAVWGSLPEFANSQMAFRWQRRFQLSAESSGCLGMFILPKQNTATCWADIEWHLQPQVSDGDCRCIRATLHRCRNGIAGRSIDLEIDTVTGNIQSANRSYNMGLHRVSGTPLATSSRAKIGSRS